MTKSESFSELEDRMKMALELRCGAGVLSGWGYPDPMAILSFMN